MKSSSLFALTLILIPSSGAFAQNTKDDKQQSPPSKDGSAGATTGTSATGPGKTNEAIFDAKKKEFTSAPPSVRSRKSMKVTVEHPNTWRYSYSLSVSKRDFHTTAIPDVIQKLIASNTTNDPNNRSLTTESSGQNILREDSSKDLTDLFKAVDDYLDSLKTATLAGSDNTDIQSRVIQPTKVFAKAIKFDSTTPISENSLIASNIDTSINDLRSQFFSEAQTKAFNLKAAYRKAVDENIKKNQEVVDKKKNEVEQQALKVDAATTKVDLAQVEYDNAKGDKDKLKAAAEKLLAAKTELTTESRKEAQLQKELEELTKKLDDESDIQGKTANFNNKVDKAILDSAAKLELAFKVLLAARDDTVTPKTIESSFSVSDADEVDLEVKITTLDTPVGRTIGEPATAAVPAGAAAAPQQAPVPEPTKKEQKFTQTIDVVGRQVTDFSIGVVGAGFTSDYYYVGKANGTSAANPGPDVVLQGAKDHPGAIQGVAFAHTYTTGSPWGLSIGAGIKDNALKGFYFGPSLIVGRRSRFFITGGIGLGQSTVLDGDRIGAPPRTGNATVSTKDRWRATPFLAISFSLNLNKNTPTGK